MSEDKLNAFTEELLFLIKQNINDNLDGYTDIKTEYWMGRLFDSRQMNTDIKKLISKYRE